MGCKVAKFGGSSLACAERFARVREIISEDPERVYVVLPAPGKHGDDVEKITDMLYSAQEKRRERKV